jgi:hypothetical protein
MRVTVKAAALAAFIGGAMPAAASAAETSADPGQEIKEGAVAFGHGVRDGAVNFGHGVRDGAVKAWGAVKSTVNDATKPADKPHKPAAPKDPPAASK